MCVFIPGAVLVFKTEYDILINKSVVYAVKNYRVLEDRVTFHTVGNFFIRSQSGVSWKMQKNADS